MKKFALVVCALCLGLVTVFGSATLAKAADVVPVGVEKAEMTSDATYLQYGPYLFYADAIAKARVLNALGFYTNVFLAIDGYWYVNAW